MRKQGSGFGFVVLVVVLGVVLLLASRALRATLPAAQALAKPAVSSGETQDPTTPADGTTQQAGESVRPAGRLPDLRELKKETDTHAAQVKSALDSTKE